MSFRIYSCQELHYGVCCVFVTMGSPEFNDRESPPHAAVTEMQINTT
jgi:hypothetical protein